MRSASTGATARWKTCRRAGPRRRRVRFLNGDKACALGASYGGFMVNWIAGNWNEPFKCLVNHDGVFDQRMMGYATEELWFTEWEQGGTPYQPANYEKFNPVNHVADWKKPILVIHGQQDFRIPVEQGLAAFTAAQRGHRIEVPVLPGREPLGAEAAQQHPVA
jgi:dipeptidyl aminopeptidase/acylaminoacyl peptidase